MAQRRSPPPPVPRPAVLSAGQIQAAIPKLERRVAELEQIVPEALSSFFDEAAAITSKINSTVADVFGMDTSEYTRFSTDDRSFLPMFAPVRDQQRRDIFVQGVASTRRKLETAIQILRERLEDLAEDSGEPSKIVEARGVLNSNIFIVHGHDEAAREEVARLLTKAGLAPIILHEQASGGRTVIEKLEHYSDVGFAVVLLTPDDQGGPTAGPLQPRARQNVIAELFYFLGKLGRSKVCALRKGDVEIPSDIGGVVYVPFDPHGGWKSALLRELEDAGYELNWGSALR